MAKKNTMIAFVDSPTGLGPTRQRAKHVISAPWAVASVTIYITSLFFSITQHYSLGILKLTGVDGSGQHAWSYLNSRPEQIFVCTTHIPLYKKYDSLSPDNPQFVMSRYAQEFSDKMQS